LSCINKEKNGTPKIKEYITKSGYSVTSAALRLGRHWSYIRRMVDMLADLSGQEKEVIKLWREKKV